MRDKPRDWRAHLTQDGPVHVDIATPAGPHRVSWHNGPLILHDHDIAAERVLRALGGLSGTCPCLLLLDALASRTSWDFDAPTLPSAVSALKRLTTDSDYLSLPEEDQTDLLLRARHRLVMQAAPPLAEVIDHAHQLHLTRRAQQTRPQGPRPRPDLNELLDGVAVPLLLQTMRSAQPALWKHAPLTAVCWKHDQGKIRLLHGWLTQLGGYIAVSLPPNWMTRVWRRRIAIVDGHFILSVDRPAPAEQLAAERLSWEAGPEDSLRAVTERCHIRKVGTQWQVEPTSASHAQ